MFKVETWDVVEFDRQAVVLVERFTQVDVEGLRTLSATCLVGNRVETSALQDLQHVGKLLITSTLIPCD